MTLNKNCNIYFKLRQFVSIKTNQFKLKRNIIISEQES